MVRNIQIEDEAIDSERDAAKSYHELGAMQQSPDNVPPTDQFGMPYENITNCIKMILIFKF